MNDDRRLAILTSSHSERLMYWTGAGVGFAMLLMGVGSQFGSEEKLRFICLGLFLAGISGMLMMAYFARIAIRVIRREIAGTPEDKPTPSSEEPKR